MKQLILKRLIIASKKAEVAKEVDFDERLTIITGHNPDGETINRTGKSLLIKSIYYSLGAELSKYTANWDNLQLSTLVTFSLDGKVYSLYRNENRFVFDDGKKWIIFQSISELRSYYVDLFNFKIKLPIRDGAENTVYAYPGAVFMPYYIDQDKGWSGSWDSFNDVFGGVWKQEILLYHLGVRTPEYYSLLEEKVSLDSKQNENKRQKATLEAVVQKHVEKYRNYLDISMSIEAFTEDIAALTNELNTQLERRNAIKDELISCLNKMRQIEELYAVANKNYHELLADADYIDNSIQETTVVCPTCGTTHANTIENRFGIYREIQECEKIMHSYFETRTVIEGKVQKQSDILNELDGYIKNIQSILSRKREVISFNDIIISEGSKSILHDMQCDLGTLKLDMAEIDLRLKEIQKEQRSITKAGNAILNMYLERLKTNLSSLDVTDIDPKELTSFKKTFSSGGNDLPCAILAQVYAIRELAGLYSPTVAAPVVLDAIFQQEPAKGKIKTIFDFVINMQPDNSQLIFSTTDVYETVKNAKVIMLTKERGLLNEDDYRKVEPIIDEYLAFSLQK